MKDYDIVYFYPSSEIFEKAAKIFAAEKEVLQKLIPTADIQQVGSCAIPGAIGKFDVDVQIRIPRESFESVKRIMQEHYQEKHRERLWNENFILFKSKDGSLYDIDYNITVIHSPQDDFYRVRDYLKNNPEALKEYNEFKMQYEGKPYHEYRTAKMKYLGGNGSVRFLDYGT